MIFLKRKKGQGPGVSGSNAAALVVVVMAFIVLYILLIPPAERDELLGGTNKTSTGGEKEEKVGGDLLLLETPGTLFKTKQEEFEHRLGAFNLFTQEEDKVLKSLDSARVTSSLRNKDAKNIVFVLDDPENTENTKLSFNVKDHNGRLVIVFNDEEIFNTEVSGTNINPISLQNPEKDNILELSASEPGLAFWSTNFYDLESLKVTGTVTNLENQEAETSFQITEEEAGLIESAFLSFFVDCKTQEVGRLQVRLNNILILSQVPDCGSEARIDIAPADLKAGRNELKFFTEEGSYIIDRPRVRTNLKEPLFPVFFFDVNATQFNEVSNNTKKAVLSLKFVDDGDNKAGIININDMKIGLDTDEKEFTKDVSERLKQGSNFLKVEPDTTLQIVELKLELKKK